MGYLSKNNLKISTSNWRTINTDESTYIKNIADKDKFNPIHKIYKYITNKLTNSKEGRKHLRTTMDNKNTSPSKLNSEIKNGIMNDSLPELKIFGQSIGTINRNQRTQESSANNKINSGISNQGNNYKKYDATRNARSKNHENNKTTQGGRTNHGVHTTIHQITNLNPTSQTTENILKFI